jgi:serine/threonine-protein kinase HipA
MPEKATEVWVMLDTEPVLAGRLWSHRRGRTESATFAYDPGYLARSNGAYQLDPALPLINGQQQTAAGRALFGAFTDSAPDRWGKRLIRRRAETGGRSGARTLGEIDFLLGVGDDLRQGALRYRDPEMEAFLAVEEEAVPPLLALPELLGAADRLERDEPDEGQLRLLLRGGSSLGGARPKANVLMPDGKVMIAKFPSVEDEHDVIRWEAVAMTLARSAGIRVTDFELRTVDGKPVLLLDRFDRAGQRRIGYVSAMTMLEATDGEGSSYPEIAEVIETVSASATDDMRELWRRVAFSVLISNTDDHLRNHGFLRLSTAGWSLSPAFDLNPDPEPGPKHLRTAITFDDDSASIENLMDAREYFRLNGDEAQGILATVRSAVARWADVAEENGLPRKEIEGMATAFEAATQPREGR